MCVCACTSCEFELRICFVCCVQVSEWFLQRDQSNQSASRDATEHGLLLFQTSSAAANLVALADTRAATQAQSDPAAQEGLKEVKSAAERLLVESTQAQLMHAERLMVARDKQVRPCVHSGVTRGTSVSVFAHATSCTALRHMHSSDTSALMQAANHWRVVRAVRRV